MVSNFPMYPNRQLMLNTSNLQTAAQAKYVAPNALESMVTGAVVKPFKDMAKNPLGTVTSLVIGGAALAGASYVAPVVVPIAAGAGAVFSGYKAVTAYTTAQDAKAHKNAKAEREAYENLGEGLAGLGFSLAGLKAPKVVNGPSIGTRLTVAKEAFKAPGGGFKAAFSALKNPGEAVVASSAGYAEKAAKLLVKADVRTGMSNTAAKAAAKTILRDAISDYRRTNGYDAVAKTFTTPGASHAKAFEAAAKAVQSEARASLSSAVARSSTNVPIVRPYVRKINIAAKRAEDAASMFAEATKPSTPFFKRIGVVAPATASLYYADSPE